LILLKDDIVWKDISEFEGEYQINQFGEVKSLQRINYMKNGVPRHVKEKYIAWKTKKNGYKFLQLWRNGKSKNFYIHRLVAKHFIENPSELDEVNHIDGNKSNNHFSNLEWVTHSENMYHAYEKELRGRCEHHQQAKLTNEQVAYILKNYKPFDNQYGAKPLSEKFNVARSTISRIAKGKRRTYG